MWCDGSRHRTARVLLSAALVLLAAPLHAQGGGRVAPPHGEPMMTWTPTLFLLADQLEYEPAGEGRSVNFDVRGWYGGARNRLWLLSQGEGATRRGEGEAEIQVLYGRLVDPFWDAVFGVRVDHRWGEGGPSRALLAAGLQGLTPYRFEFAPTLFISQRGELSARLELGTQLLFTQRLIAEPEAELNAALQAVPAFGVRSGFGDYETGIRLRYEFRRELAPYVGLSRSRRGGVGAGASNRLVVGVRVWH